MTIKCLHGFFILRETKAGDISEFASLFRAEVSPWRDAFTFKFLANAPSYAIKGATYLGAPVTKTIEGEPWEILKANGLVYDFNAGKLISITSVSNRFRMSEGSKYYPFPGLLMPGSLTVDGRRVTDYSARHLQGVHFVYSEVTRV